MLWAAVFVPCFPEVFSTCWWDAYNNTNLVLITHDIANYASTSQRVLTYGQHLAPMCCLAVSEPPLREADSTNFRPKSDSQTEPQTPQRIKQIVFMVVVKLVAETGTEP